MIAAKEIACALARVAQGNIEPLPRRDAERDPDKLRLHRIEAACLPENVASMTLLERNGFRREGLARAYLRINGAWRDHVLYGLLEPEAARLG